MPLPLCYTPRFEEGRGMMAVWSTIFFCLSGIGLAQSTPVIFPTELQLPVVTLQSHTGEERTTECLLRGEATIDSGTLTLKNIQNELPQGASLHFSPSVQRNLNRLFLEAVSISLSKQLLVAQLELRRERSTQPISEFSLQLSETGYRLKDIPLSFVRARNAVFVTHMRFHLDASGQVTQAKASLPNLKEFNVEDFEPVTESLNPWDALEWITEGKKSKPRGPKPRSLKRPEAPQMRPLEGLFDDSALDWLSLRLLSEADKASVRDDASRFLLRGGFTYAHPPGRGDGKPRTATSEPSKNDEDIARGCAAVGRCGCLLAGAGGGVGITLLYWLFN
jgi:hypothetical protein